MRVRNFVDLAPEERLRLLRIVCSFAWSDLEVSPSERAMIGGLVRGLELPPEEVAKVDGWLDHPPRARDLDPQEIPREHAELLLEAVRAIIRADGVVKEEEVEDYLLLQQLLRYPR